MQSKNEIFSLDSVDMCLLEELQQDAGLSNLALSARLGVSPATCLRRTRRLEQLGVIEHRLAILNPERLALALGHGLTALIEVTLDRQDEATLVAFEERIRLEPAVQQCYRVSPGPDFMLVTHCSDMPAYLNMSQRLFTADGSVRNVRAFFSVKRVKFEPRLPIISI